MDYFQASTQLARNVELRLHGCTLLARVKPVVMEGMEGEKKETSLLREVERRCSRAGRSAPVKTNRTQMSYSLVEEHKVRLKPLALLHQPVPGHHHSGCDHGGVLTVLEPLLHQQHRAWSVQGTRPTHHPPSP